MRDQERFQKIFSDLARARNAYVHQMGPAIQGINRLNKQMESYASLVRNLEANFAPFISQAVEMQNNLNLIAASVNTNFLRNPQFIHFAKQANDIAKVIANLEPETISEIYSQAIGLHSNTGKENSDSIESTIAEIEEHTKSSGSLLSVEFYLSIVFTIVLYLMAQSSSEESDKLLFERLDRLEHTLLESYNAAAEKEVNASFYVVKKNVPFRKGPSTKHEIITILFSNQKVKLVTRNSKWIKVEYYDHIDDSSKQGWVHKKRLKLLNPKKPTKYVKP
ncbi:MAG: SH3 domain-containing protein [Methylophilaceae bacterium]